jgi:phosphohistidine phosphatase SixA
LSGTHGRAFGLAISFESSVSLETLFIQAPTLGDMKPPRAIGLVALLALLLGFTARAQDGWNQVQSGTVVLFRHALAPGTGDPTNFTLNDCATQRNLSDEGRTQARRIGEAFKSRGINVARVLTSQWCRTRETAQLAFPGLVQDAPEFNSFFNDRTDEPNQTRTALETLGKWRGPGVLVVVTHQVNITALTQVVPDSGEGVVVRVVAGKLEVLGRIKP